MACWMTSRKRGLMRSPKISARHPLQKRRWPKTVPLRSPPPSSGRAASSTKLHLNVPQRAALEVVQDATARAADMLKVTCPPDDVVTPVARLAALANRLDTMLQAVKLVRPALEDFYATLSDEQKAQFEAIGPKRTV
jgi:hypothetical protein